MLQITNTETFGWDAAIRGMRNPKNSWALSDSYWTHIEDPETLETANYQFFTGEKDLTLMKTLANAGSDHGKFLRMIHVQCDIVAPVYWAAELDTYKVGTVRDSCSMMHKGIRDYTLDDFSFEDLCPEFAELVVAQANRLVDAYRKNPSEQNFRAFREFMPMGFNYRFTWDANYAVLRNIYHSRKNHRLSEWHTFCEWIEGLPYAEELITGKD